MFGTDLRRACGFIRYNWILLTGAAVLVYAAVAFMWTRGQTTEALYTGPGLEVIKEVAGALRDGSPQKLQPIAATPDMATKLAGLKPEQGGRSIWMQESGSGEAIGLVSSEQSVRQTFFFRLKDVEGRWLITDVQEARNVGPEGVWWMKPPYAVGWKRVR